MYSAIVIKLLAIFTQGLVATCTGHARDSRNELVHSQAASKLVDRVLKAEPIQDVDLDATTFAKTHPDMSPSNAYTSPMKPCSHILRHFSHSPFAAPQFPLAPCQSRVPVPRYLPASQAHQGSKDSMAGSGQSRWPQPGKGKSPKVNVQAGTAGHFDENSYNEVVQRPVSYERRGSQYSQLAQELASLDKLVAELTETASAATLQAVTSGIAAVAWAIAAPVSQIVPSLGMVVATAVAEAAKAAAAVSAATGNAAKASELTDTAVTAEKVKEAAAGAARLMRGYLFSAPAEARAVAVTAATLQATAQRVKKAIAAAKKEPPARAKAILMEAGTATGEAEKAFKAENAENLDGEAEKAIIAAASAKVRRTSLKILGAAGVAAAQATADMQRANAETQQN